MEESTGEYGGSFRSGGDIVVPEGTVIFVTLIRHGATAGNAEKRYIGARTDEPLSSEGRRQLRGLHFRRPDRLYASPMRRCIETAEILFDGQNVWTIENFRETDFGAFEGKNYRDLAGNPVYQAWIDSNGEMAFPGGESRENFIRRSAAGFREMVQDIEHWLAQRPGAGSESRAGDLEPRGISGAYDGAMLKWPQSEAGREPETWCSGTRAGEAETTAVSVCRAAAVVHGGTIMAVLQSLFGGDYYSYRAGNGEGYVFLLERTAGGWVPRDLREIETCPAVP